MADTDSFINEVTEEVRRDRLFAMFRRWAWLAVLVVVAVVGGAAFYEYQRAQAEAEAEAFGDAIIGALDLSEPAARIAALDAIDPPDEEGDILLALLAAGEATEAAGQRAAAERLRRAAEGADLAVRYRHLALLKAHMLAPAEPDEARLVLGGLAEPGAPYAALAEEQLALLDLAEGDLDAALERLRRLEIAAEATPGLQQRAAQLMVALESGARLVEGSPAANAPEASGGSGLGADLLPPALGALPGADTASEPAEAPAPGAAEDE